MKIDNRNFLVGDRKKILSSFLAIFFVLGVVYFPVKSVTVPVAHAVLGVPTNEMNPSVLSALGATSGSTAATAPTSGFTMGSLTISNVLNGIAWAVAKAAVQSITQSTVRWINSGFEGSPGFVTNLQETLTQLGDHVAGQFLSQLVGSTFLCSPFRLQVASALQTSYYQGYFANSCTLTGIVSNIENFTKGTFSEGGWRGWFSMTTQTQGNAYSAYNAAKYELSARLVNAQGQQVKLLDWGKGFMSWCGNNTMQDVKNSEYAAAQAAGDENVVQVTAQKTSAGCGVGETVQTPGSVIEGQLAQQLGSGVEQLNLADSINEIVGALVQQLVSRVMGGVGGLLGSSNPSSGGGSSLVNLLGTDNSAANDIAISTMNKVLAGINQELPSLGTYKADIQTIGDAAIDAKSALENVPVQAAPTCGLPTNTDVATTLKDVVQPAVDQTQQAIATTEYAISEYNRVGDEAQSVIDAANAGDDTTVALQKTGNDYQLLISSSTVPTVGDFVTAAAQSKPSEGTASSTAPTLYGELTQIAAAARACVVPSTGASGGGGI